MGKTRTAGGPAPRDFHPRVVLTRPDPLPATLLTLGLWLSVSFPPVPGSWPQVIKLFTGDREVARPVGVMAYHRSGSPRDGCT